MNARKEVAFAAIISVLAFVSPILLSLKLAWNLSISDARTESAQYASGVLRRAEETARQFRHAIDLLQTDQLPPCSPPELDLMRQLDVGSSNIQMVGRVSGDTLQCTSLGTTALRDLGPPTLVTAGGVSEWLDFRFGPQRFDHLDLLSANGVAVIVDSKLMSDIDVEGTGVSLALFVPSTPDHARLMQTQGDFRPSWFNPIPHGQSNSFIEGGHVVAQVRSRNRDLEAVAVVPLSFAYKRVGHFAAVSLPIGGICGLLLAWAVSVISRARLSPQGLLRAAARDGDFYLEYQPVIQLDTGHIVGAEALVRWRRGDTVISPASFIPLAVESGLSPLITQCVMEIVTRDLPKLLYLAPGFHIAMNLTAGDLRSPDLTRTLRELLKNSGALPHNVVLEATEHGFLECMECQKNICALRADGFTVAIDDFGTGYSSLSVLQKLNLDVLKIDRAFVETIGTEGPTHQVVLHIIEIARELNLKLVAEGVETETQAQFLRERGVEYAQGWLFGRPMSLDALCDRIQASNEAERVQPAYSL